MKSKLKAAGCTVHHNCPLTARPNLTCNRKQLPVSESEQTLSGHKKHTGNVVFAKLLTHTFMSVTEYSTSKRLYMEKIHMFLSLYKESLIF